MTLFVIHSFVIKTNCRKQEHQQHSIFNIGIDSKDEANIVSEIWIYHVIHFYLLFSIGIYFFFSYVSCFLQIKTIKTSNFSNKIILYF